MISDPTTKMMAQARIPTLDLRIVNPALYRLSYLAPSHINPGKTTVVHLQHLWDIFARGLVVHYTTQTIIFLKNRPVVKVLGIRRRSPSGSAAHRAQCGLRLSRPCKVGRRLSDLRWFVGQATGYSHCPNAPHLDSSSRYDAQDSVILSGDRCNRGVLIKTLS